MDLVWQHNDAHSVSLKYQLTNDAASIRQLNPINTSADPLYKVIGNPRLKPQTMHYVPLVYSFTKKEMVYSSTSLLQAYQQYALCGILCR